MIASVDRFVAVAIEKAVYALKMVDHSVVVVIAEDHPRIFVGELGSAQAEEAPDVGFRLAGGPFAGGDDLRAPFFRPGEVVADQR